MNQMKLSMGIDKRTKNICKISSLKRNQFLVISTVSSVESPSK